MILTLQALRIAFFGSKNFAAYHLYMLLCCSIHKVVAVFTQEIKYSFQKKEWSIFKITTAYKLNIFQSHRLLKSDIIFILKKLNVDIIVVVSYGLIFPQEILTIPKFGCINVHGSLLPRWRGPAPIPRSIEHGDSITGISIIQMDPGVDTGNILYYKTCKISSTDTSDILTKKLARIGAVGLLQTIEKIILGIQQVIPQNTTYITYASKLHKKEARINWNSSAEELERRIRAFNSWPVSYFYVFTKRIRVWNAHVDIENIKENKSSAFFPGLILKANTSGIYVATGYGILVLTKLQISGKKKSHVKDILNAYQKLFKPNSILY